MSRERGVRIPTDAEFERARNALANACEPAIQAIRDFGHAMPRRLTDAELIAALRRRPYDRAAREAAQRLEELTRSDQRTRPR